MDIYSDNHNLEELSEAVREYITVSNKFRSHSSLKSSQKLYMRNIQSRLHHKEKEQTKKIQSLIPDRVVSASSLNILSLLSRAHPLSLQYIDTLFVSDNHFHLFYTSEGTIKHIKGQLAYFLFFKRNQNSLRTPFKYPQYIFKSETEIELIYSERMAQMRLRAAQHCVLQRFVFPRGDRVIKVRVHWKAKAPAHAYLLSNKLRVPRRSHRNSSMAIPHVDKNESLLTYLQKVNAKAMAQSIYINKAESLAQTDEEPSMDLSPYILQSAIKTDFSESEDGFPKRENSSKKNIPFISIDHSIKESEKPYLIMDKYPSLWSSKKLQKIDTELQRSVNTLVQFLNLKGIKPTELVIDFLRDPSKKWYFSSIPQYSSSDKFLHRRSVASLAEKAASKSEFSFSRFSHKLESLSIHRQNSMLGESINTRNIRDRKNSIDCNIISNATSPKKSIASVNTVHFQIESEKKASVQSTVQKVYNDSIKKFDQLIVRVKRLHMKNNEICAKYGGERFIKSLVAEFYKRILESEQLRELYESVDQEEMNLIAKKYKKMLNFTSTLSFRKSFKELCFSDNMSDEHYQEYFQILAQVMNDFGVKKIDQDVILDEIHYITNTTIHC